MNPSQFKLEMWSIMNQLKTGMQNFVNPLLEEYDLTFIQASLLMELLAGNPVNISGIAKSFGLNQGNVSTMCKQMERNGLIQRTRNQSDERIVMLNITDLGKEKIVDLLAKVDSMSVALDSIPPEKLQTIIAGMSELSQMLKLFAPEK